MWEPGGDRLSEGLSQVGCKIPRAEVLRAITSLPSLSPAEWDTVVMGSLRSLLTRQHQSLVLFLRVFCAPGQTGRLFTFPKLEFDICVLLLNLWQIVLQCFFNVVITHEDHRGNVEY